MSTVETTAEKSATGVAWPPKADLLGIGVSLTDYDTAVASIMAAARAGQSAIVSCHAVHAIVTCADDDALRAGVNQFDMITPDGQPVRWALNWLHKAKLAERVYGPELMQRLCRAAAAQRVPVYLYGGSEQVACQLPERLVSLFPGLRIVGSESPPYRPLTAEESAAVDRRIVESGAKLLFIGLGCPKQDQFALDHRGLPVVQLCVGAAFDFLAGNKASAPAWMQRRGLEWLFRLLHEPKRLWRRYLTTNTRFVWEVAKATFRRG